MEFLKSFLSSLSFLDKVNFDQKVLELFRFQAIHNPLYREFVKIRNIDSSQVENIEDIPFLPIELFKNHQIKSGQWDSQHVFESSGTTGADTSKHLLFDGEMYHTLASETFEFHFGDLRGWHILALLPSYLERNNSSLVYMVSGFIKRSGSSYSGFYLDQWSDLNDTLAELLSNKENKVLVLGVTFALIDFVNKFPQKKPSGTLLVMETGGMKGRKEEMTRSQVHEILKAGFQTNHITSEYGMTELMSQAYSKQGEIFYPASTMKILIREIEDPYTYQPFGKIGAINVIDLGNAATCAFVETKDLGRLYEDGSFEVLGRMDNSDVRGCNLMMV
jgi:hypothetical protein